jgi:ElaB/YqjD/DUF883 family membrane-anchored ribosome-binding protein
MSAIHSNGHQPPADLTELRHEIEQTRADLGATVEALAAKADVKARAHEAVEDVKIRAHEAVADVKARAGSSMGRLARSVREHPAPWVVGTALILLAAAIAPQRQRFAGTLAGPRSRRLAARRVAQARAPFSGSRRWWR